MYQNESLATGKPNMMQLLNYAPNLLIAQIYIMFLTDLSWGVCSANFILIWFLHLFRLNQVILGKFII